MTDPGTAAQRNTVNDLSEWEFRRRFGTWDPLTPEGARDLFGGAPFTWWIAGGWSLELDGGSPAPSRQHEDLDVAFAVSDLPAVRAWLSTWHIWEADRGIRPLLPVDEPRSACEQWWLRRDAWSPWVLDLLHTPTDGADWLFKKDHRVRRPLAEVLRRDHHGIPYQAPEVTLLFKAFLDREKDRHDLAVTWHRLDLDARDWLRQSVALALPDSPWGARLDGLAHLR